EVFENWDGVATAGATIENQNATVIQTHADSAGNLAGRYFILNDDVGTVGVWFDIANSGAAMPAGAAAADRQVKVFENGDGDIPLNASAAVIAGAIAFAFDIPGDAKLKVIQGGVDTDTLFVFA